MAVSISVRSFITKVMVYLRRRPQGRGLRWPIALILAFGVANGYAQNQAALQAKLVELREPLASSWFKRPLVLESTQANEALKGEVFAIVAQPLALVKETFQRVQHWCDILILHLNVKQCVRETAGASEGLSVAIGRKFDQPLSDAYVIRLTHEVLANERDYLNVALRADQGPMGTKNYRIVLESIAIDATNSFIHMSYSYAYGAAARTALQMYLATVGRAKVGFSIVGHSTSGTPIYVGNLRGLMERNTMRYFLAIESYLGALKATTDARAEKRLRDWFNATERYARQLHELDMEDYLTMKYGELERQKLAERGK